MLQLQQSDHDLCAHLRSWDLERERRRLLATAVCNSFLQRALRRPVSPLSSDEDLEREQEVRAEGLACGEYDPASETDDEYVPAGDDQAHWEHQEGGCGVEGEKVVEGDPTWQERLAVRSNDSPNEYVTDDHPNWGKRNSDAVWECTEEYVPQNYGSKHPWGHMASQCKGANCDCIVVKLPSGDSDSEEEAEGGEIRKWWGRALEKGWAHMEDGCPGEGCDYVVVRLPSSDEASEEEPE